MAAGLPAGALAQSVEDLLQSIDVAPGFLKVLGERLKGH